MPERKAIALFTRRGDARGEVEQLISEMRSTGAYLAGEGVDFNGYLETAGVTAVWLNEDGRSVAETLVQREGWRDETERNGLPPWRKAWSQL